MLQTWVSSASNDLKTISHGNDKPNKLQIIILGALIKRTASRSHFWTLSRWVGTARPGNASKGAACAPCRNRLQEKHLRGRRSTGTQSEWRGRTSHSKRDLAWGATNLPKGKGERCKSEQREEGWEEEIHTNTKMCDRPERTKKRPFASCWISQFYDLYIL